eukprot:NODE_261_length_12589_cov_0.423139.p10 type:complete len:108 gc:universal NODE_261_length_12589_cov_0.423139:12517-12194(-)
MSHMHLFYIFLIFLLLNRFVSGSNMVSSNFQFGMSLFVLVLTTSAFTFTFSNCLNLFPSPSSIICCSKSTLLLIICDSSKYATLSNPYLGISITIPFFVIFIIYASS